MAERERTERDDDRGRGSSNGKKARFEYKERKIEDVEKRAAQKGGMFDSVFKSDFSVYTAKDGDNLVRILPPTWDDPSHYGFDIYVHYGIGPDNNTYLCLNKMKGEQCPLCDARNEIARDDEDAAKSLRPNQRVVMWVIDREDERAGPQLWSCPWTLDKEISALSVDKRKADIIALDEPDHGYDLEFKREGKGTRTEYIGVRIARAPSPISDDPDEQEEWLDFIASNPIPLTLNFYDTEYLSKVFGGGKASAKEEVADRPSTRRSRRSRDDTDEEEAETRRGRRSRADEEEEEVPRDRDGSPRRERLRSDTDEKELDERSSRRRETESKPERTNGATRERSAVRSTRREEVDDEEVPDRASEGRTRRRGR